MEHKFLQVLLEVKVQVIPSRKMSCTHVHFEALFSCAGNSKSGRVTDVAAGMGGCYMS